MDERRQTGEQVAVLADAETWAAVKAKRQVAELGWLVLVIGWVLVLTLVVLGRQMF